MVALHEQYIGANQASLGGTNTRVFEGYQFRGEQSPGDAVEITQQKLDSWLVW